MGFFKKALHTMSHKKGKKTFHFNGLALMQNMSLCIPISKTHFIKFPNTRTSMNGKDQNTSQGKEGLKQKLLHTVLKCST